MLLGTSGFTGYQIGKINGNTTLQTGNTAVERTVESQGVAVVNLDTGISDRNTHVSYTHLKVSDAASRIEIAFFMVSLLWLLSFMISKSSSIGACLLYTSTALACLLINHHGCCEAIKNP